MENTEAPAGRVLVIRSSEWARGGRVTRLANGDGTFCCLGLDALDRGASVASLMVCDTSRALVSTHKEDTPRGYAEDWTELVNRKLYVQNSDARSAVALNDDESLDDDERIEALRPIFAKHGITLDWRPNE